MHGEATFSLSEHSSPEQPPTRHTPTSMAPVAVCRPPPLHPASAHPNATTKPTAERFLMVWPVQQGPHSPAHGQSCHAPGGIARLLGWRARGTSMHLRFLILAAAMA